MSALSDLASLTGARQDAARELLTRVHGDAELERTYPLVFDPRFSGRIVTVEEQGQVRAACATLARDFLVQGAGIPIGLIGSVATDEGWRRRGLGTRLLERARQELREQGCAFALLWAREPGYYLKRGFTPVGTELDFLLVSELALALPEPDGARESGPADAAAIHELYSAHPVRVRRTVEETAALLGCPGMQTLVRERRGAVVAYACLGRGRDLADAIHEWGGDSVDVLALVRAHLERRFPARESGCLFLMTPAEGRGASELAYRLVRAGAPSKRGLLGLGTILDREAAAGLLAEQLGASASVTLVDGPQGQRFRIRGPADEGELDDEAVLALLFATSEVRGEARRMLQRFGLERARLPLEPFAWGLDSI